jgi:hypothetical protein
MASKRLPLPELVGVTRLAEKAEAIRYPRSEKVFRC